MALKEVTREKMAAATYLRHFKAIYAEHTAAS